MQGVAKAGRASSFGPSPARAAIVIVLLAGASLAAAPVRSGEGKPAPQAPVAEPPRPAAELSKLGFLIGRWRTKEQVFAGLADPKGATSDSVSEIQWALDGRFVRQDYGSGAGADSFSGIGLLTYDAEEREYRAWWFDPLGSGDEMRGGWTGDDLVLSGEGTMNGVPLRTRSTYHDIGAERFVVTFEQALAGGHMQKAFELTYTRNRAPGGGAGDAPPRPSQGAPASPGAELKRIEAFVGKWVTSETIYPSERTPQGGKGAGTAESGWRLEGRFVQSAYASKGPMGPFEELSLFTYDAEKKAYRNWRFDSAGTAEEYRGNWEGDRLVMTGLTKVRGAAVSSKLTYFDVKPDSYTISIEGSIAGAPMRKAIQIVCSRAR